MVEVERNQTPEESAQQTPAEVSVGLLNRWKNRVEAASFGVGFLGLTPLAATARTLNGGIARTVVGGGILYGIQEGIKYLINKDIKAVKAANEQVIYQANETNSPAVPPQH